MASLLAHARVTTQWFNQKVELVVFVVRALKRNARVDRIKIQIT
jgi:hypothetical protein